MNQSLTIKNLVFKKDTNSRDKNNCYYGWLYCKTGICLRQQNDDLSWEQSTPGKYKTLCFNYCATAPPKISIQHQKSEGKHL